VRAVGQSKGRFGRADEDRADVQLTVVEFAGARIFFRAEMFTCRALPRRLIGSLTGIGTPARGRRFSVCATAS